MSWQSEDMPRGASAVFSDKLGFNIILSPEGSVEHVEDIKRGTSYPSVSSVDRELDRLTKLKTKLKELKCQ